MSKKDDIIETATRLFNLYSYSSIGVDRIIFEANVAKTTFYKYFHSKENLIKICLEIKSKQVQESIKNFLDENK